MTDTTESQDIDPERGLRVLVTGSRDFKDESIIRRELEAVGLDARRNSARVTLVHGAARGADTIAAAVARSLGWRVEAHPAQWDTLGKRAGYVRNAVMVDSGVDVVLGFPIGESRGTRMCIDLARRRGVATIRVVEQEERDER